MIVLKFAPQVCRANRTPPSFALKDRRCWRAALKKAWLRRGCGTRGQRWPEAVAEILGSKIPASTFHVDVDFATLVLGKLLGLLGYSSAQTSTLVTLELDAAK